MWFVIKVVVVAIVIVIVVSKVIVGFGLKRVRRRKEVKKKSLRYLFLCLFSFKGLKFS